MESDSSDDEGSSMDTPDENPAKYCRLCFSIAQPLEPVFSSPHDQGSPIAHLVRDSMSVLLVAQEDFPCAICRECFQRLTEFQRFRQLFQTLNQVVRRKKNNQRAVLAKKAKRKDSEKADPVESNPVPVVDSTTNGCELQLKEELIDLSDEEGYDPIVSNGPSAETVEDMDEDDQPYTALDDDWFCCRQCNRMFQTLAVMVDHLRDNHPSTVSAQQMAPSGSSVGGHSNIMHAVVSDGARFFKCNDCDTMLVKKSNMITHWNRFHKDGQTQKVHCAVKDCTRFFMHNKSYRRHLQIQHGITDPTTIVKYRTCSLTARC